MQVSRLLLLFALPAAVRVSSYLELAVLLLLCLSRLHDAGASHAASECRSREWSLRGEARLLRLCPGYLQGRLEQGERQQA